LLETLLNLFTQSDTYLQEDPNKVLSQMKMLSLGTVKTVERLKQQLNLVNNSIPRVEAAADKLKQGKNIKVGKDFA
jgi:esterase/lipase